MNEAINELNRHVFTSSTMSCKVTMEGKSGIQTCSKLILCFLNFLGRINKLNI